MDKLKEFFKNNFDIFDIFGVVLLGLGAGLMHFAGLKKGYATGRGSVLCGILADNDHMKKYAEKMATENGGIENAVEIGKIMIEETFN